MNGLHFNVHINKRQTIIIPHNILPCLSRFVKTSNSVVLDYHVSIIPLENADRILSYGELGNFSVAGFEMGLERHLSHYLITYYLPSGQYPLSQQNSVFSTLIGRGMSRLNSLMLLARKESIIGAQRMARNTS